MTLPRTPQTRPTFHLFPAARWPLAMSALVAVGLAGCWFGNSPDKLNKQIDDGKPAKALTVIEEELISTPESPALNLLAIKARLALCHERACMTETKGLTPPLLNGLGKLAAHVNGPVKLSEETPPLTLQQVFAHAITVYQTTPQQPEAVLALYHATPANYQPQVAESLFYPPLTKVRAGHAADAAELLTTLAKPEGQPASLPGTYTYAATMLAGMLNGNTDAVQTNLIALRSSQNPPLPAQAAALLPWALKTHAATTSGTSAADVLTTLPQRIKELNLGNTLTSTTRAALAQELVTTAATPQAREQWQHGWSGTPESLTLTLQRTALSFAPNQPDLWALYLPALVSETIKAGPSATMPGTTDLPVADVTSASAPAIAGHVLAAARRLVDYPAVATPLIGFAGRIEISKPQQVELEKLSQDLLIKAAGLGDVTSTLALAQTLPGVAQNNRQSVVPLLVRYIRDNLRQGNFTAATNTADLLTNTLKMDIEFAPLVLEEFAEDLKRRKIAEKLNADTPDILLESQAQAALDLGPLFGFMQTQFADQPKVITAQLTTLIAEATGVYGQPTAMYRLGNYFPASTMDETKQKEWLGAALEQSLLTDTKLNGLQLAEITARLLPIHTTLNPAPLLETALKRTQGLEDHRTLWQQATPQVREVLRAIRPQFVMLMQGIDALADKRLNTAAQALSGITEPTWFNEAKPFIEQFNDRLLDLSGVYVPVSPAPALKTAAIVLAPEGLNNAISGNSRLNTVSITFISRVGGGTESEPTAMRTNAASVHRFDLSVVYNFDTLTLPVTPQAVSQASGGGTFNSTYGAIRALRLQEGNSPLLSVTLADGTSTPFIRTLIDPTQPLRPDGVYALQSRLGTTTSATQNILPPGSLLTLATESALQPTPMGADTTAPEIYPLSGSLRHPASAQPISVSGYFEPRTLTSTFQFNYPLPLSAQPARAAVRCQTLAGPIVCGAHNLNSARQAYAALTVGLQTRESLTTATAARATLNNASAERMLTNAAQVSVPSAEATLELTPPSKGTPTTSGLLPPPGILTPTSPTVPATVSVTPSVTPTSPVAVTPPSPTHPTMAEEEEYEEQDDTPTPASPPLATSSSEPAPGAFINNSGSRLTSATNAVQPDVEPGVFINNSGGRANSTTTP